MIKVYDAVNDGVKDIFSVASWNSIVHSLVTVLTQVESNIRLPLVTKKLFKPEPKIIISSSNYVCIVQEVS